jgi:hypothetical protein
MKIIYKAILYTGLGLYYTAVGIKIVGNFLEDFANKKLNG